LQASVLPRPSNDPKCTLVGRTMRLVGVTPIVAHGQSKFTP
jgi:hypothetical protein